MATTLQRGPETRKFRPQDPTTDEDAVRQVIDALGDAVRMRDVDAMLALCTPDVTSSDMVPPLRHRGREDLRRIWGEALCAFTPPLDHDVRDLYVSVDGEVAWCRALLRFGGVLKDGHHIVRWMGATYGLRKIEGHWKIAHEHVSVPFDMQSGKALLDLEP